jgi:hypothetical protein
VLQDELGGEHRGAQVEIERGRPASRVSVGEARAEDCATACVVDEDVRAGRVEEPGDGLVVEQVDVVVPGLGLGLCRARRTCRPRVDRFDRLAAGLVVEVDQDDLGAFLGQAYRDGAARADRGAGDDCSLAEDVHASHSAVRHRHLGWYVSARVTALVRSMGG